MTEPKQSIPKQSFTWWSFANKLDAKTLFKAAVEIGYKGIDIPPDEHLELARDCGLEIVNLQAHMPLEAGLNHTENLAQIKEQLIKKLELAKKHNVKQLICFSGNRQGLSEEAGYENMLENLRELVPLAESAGVTLTLEMLNSKVDHPDYQADSTARAVDLCKHIDSPQFKLLYDIYHMQIMEGDIIRTLKENAPFIAHYHTAGNPGRQDLDMQQEIAYPAVFEAIKTTGYQGYIAHEFTPKGDPIEALERAYLVTLVSWNSDLF